MWVLGIWTFFFPELHACKVRIHPLRHLPIFSFLLPLSSYSPSLSSSLSFISLMFYGIIFYLKLILRVLLSLFYYPTFFNESNFNELHWITNNRKCKVCWLIAQQQSTGPKTYKSQILIRSTARTNQQTKINVNILSTNH